MSQIDIYTSKTCIKCMMAKNYFTEKGLEFTEHNVDDTQARVFLAERGVFSLPYIVIDGLGVEGFDTRVVDTLLGGNLNG